MLTNRINVTYNIENIDADFDIFRVEKGKFSRYKEDCSGTYNKR